MASQSQIELIVSVIDQATAELKRIAAETEGVGRAAQQTEKTGLQRLTAGMMDLKAGMDFAMQAGRAFVGVFQQTLELGRQAGQIQRAETAFRNLSGGVAEAEANLQAMQTATRGTLSEIQSMAAANKLMAMGLAEGADELEQVAGMAVRLGQAFGKDAASSIEEFSLMLANQSIPRLDTFGISSGKVRQRIEELQRQFPGMTREVAFMQATVEQGTAAMERLGPAIDDTATSVEQAEAAFADMKTELLEGLAPALKNVATGLDVVFSLMAGDLKDAVVEHELDVRRTSETYELYRAEMRRVAVEMNTTTGAIGMLNEEQWNADRAAQGAAAALEAEQQAATAAATRLEVLGQAARSTGAIYQNELVQSIDNARRAQQELDAQMAISEGVFSAAEAAVRQSNIPLQERQTLLTMLKIASGELTPEELAMQQAIEHATKSRELGLITDAEYVEVLGQLIDGTTTYADLVNANAVPAMEELTERTGGAAEQAGNLRGELEGMPAEVRINVIDNLEEAEARAERVLARLREIGGTPWTATISTNVGGVTEGELRP